MFWSPVKVIAWKCEFSHSPPAAIDEDAVYNGKDLCAWFAWLVNKRSSCSNDWFAAS